MAAKPSLDTDMAADAEKRMQQSEVFEPALSGPESEGSWTNSWTPDEEKRLVRKIDCIVMPILMVVFFGLQLDRANMGNALTDNFLADVGITQNQFNVGTQLLNTGIVLLEIPSNLVLYRVGPKAWIGTQVFAWGLVATFQCFQKGFGSFLATRILLGLCESGFIPGSLYCISQWYRVHELSRRYAFFFLGNGIATAAGGLIAYGILHMRGLAGLAGWQWLFILEGIFSILTGVLFVALFPGLPDKPVSFFRVSYFNSRELMILRERKALDNNAAEGAAKHRITLSDLLTTLKDVKLWLHILLTTVGLAPSTALWSYAPTIVSSFGYNKLKSNAMTSVGQWISVSLVVIGGFIADKTGRRGLFVFAAVFIEFVFTLAYKCLPDDAHRGTKYGLLMMASATCSWWHAANGSWISINARSPAEKSIRMAMFIMAANTAGIVGGQLFRSDDKPFYHRGWTISVAFMALSVAVSTALLVLYVLANMRIKKDVQTKSHGNAVAVDLSLPGQRGEKVEAAGEPGAPVVKLFNY